jgi:hypothetical protein
MRAISALLLFAIAACSGGGSGGSPAPSGGHSSGRDQPSSTRDVPNANGAAYCIACDRNYACTEAGRTDSSIEVLTTHDGWCGTDKAGVACGGVVYEDGSILAGGTWRPLAGGGFELCAPNVPCVDCMPTNKQPPTIVPEPQPGTILDGG